MNKFVLKLEGGGKYYVIKGGSLSNITDVYGEEGGKKWPKFGLRNMWTVLWYSNQNQSL